MSLLQRVTQRYLKIAREFDSAQIQDKANAVQAAFNVFTLQVNNVIQSELQRVRSSGGASVAPLSSYSREGQLLIRDFMNLYGRGNAQSMYDIAHWILQTRQIPQGRAREVNSMVKFHSTNRRVKEDPKSLIEWLEKNHGMFDLLFEGLRWPEKAVAGEGNGVGVSELFNVGAFEVHNTLHLAGADLERIKQVVAEASQYIRGAGSLAARVLYGAVHVTQNLSNNHNSRAWYYPAHDDIYLKPHDSVGKAEVHSLVHELGHRFWFKFSSRPQQELWSTFHYATQRASLGARATDIPEVEVGKPLPLPPDTNLSRKDKKTFASPVRSLVSGGNIIELENGTQIITQMWKKIFHDAARATSFPTAYAQTSAEEHFAEAFAKHCIGGLDAVHTAKLSEIFGL